MNLIKYNIDLNIISKYRTHLMGLATIMIFACHAVVYKVELPHIVLSALNLGNLGVEIFLSMSGVGCYFSLSKFMGGKSNLQDWYKKRLVRIFVPYLLIQVPFYVIKLLMGNFDFLREMYILSTISYWFDHSGAWYISALIPIYLIAPFLFKLSKNYRLFGILSVITIVVCLIFASIQIDSNSQLLNSVVKNAQFVISRIPCYIIGFDFATRMISKREINSLLLIIVPLILWIVISLAKVDIYITWLLVFPIVFTFCYVIKLLTKLQPIFAWFGAISLESYLANLYLIKISDNIINLFNIHERDNTLEYCAIIIVGVLIAYITNKLSQHVKI